ncbi:MAG: PAS domain S-box protein [Candidatus Schekmanbacteria bacterium]|nr:PAS domain S-box protein [Candidatus Schekmanbacteria bacterium]
MNVALICDTGPSCRCRALAAAAGGHGLRITEMTAASALASGNRESGIAILCALDPRTSRALPEAARAFLSPKRPPLMLLVPTLRQVDIGPLLDTGVADICAADDPLRLVCRRLKNAARPNHGNGVAAMDLTPYRRVVGIPRASFVYSHNPHGVFTFLSPTVTDVLGYSAEEFCTHYTEYLTANPINELVVSHTDGSLRGEVQPPYDVELYRKDGSVCHLVVSEVPVIDETGQVVAVEGLATDVTERVVAEENLKRSYAILEALIENTGDFILYSDECGFPVFFNTAYAHIMMDVLGLEMRPGIKPHELLPEAADREFWDQCHRRVLAGERFSFEYRIPLGEPRYLEVRYNPAIKDGKVIGFSEISHDITAHKLAEQELRKHRDQLHELVRQRTVELESKERRYRTYVDAAPHGIFIFDAQGRFLEANPAACELTGFGAAELRGLCLADLVHPDDRADCWRLLSELLERGKMSAELHCVRANKSDLYLSLATVEVAPGRYLGFAEDTTDRKHMEDDLRASERKYRDLVETSQDLIWQCDIEGRFTYLNPAWEKTHGLPLGEMLGRRFADFVPPDEAAACSEAFEQCLHEGNLVGLEAAHVAKDGRVVHLIVNAIPLLADSGFVVGTQGTAHDRTAKKLLEEELRESRRELEQANRMLRLVLDTIPVRVFWKDLSLAYLGCNLPFARDAGSESPEDLLGRNDFDMVWRNEAPRYRLDDRQVISTGIPKLGFDEPQSTPAGTTIWLRTSKVPLRDGDGKIIGVLGTYEDITERKNAERERRELEEQVRHAQKLESLGVLAGGIAHDFNNLLTALFGGIDLALLRLGPDQPARTHLETMATAAARMAELTNQMLAYAGKAHFEQSLVDITTVVRDMSPLLQMSVAKTSKLAFDLSIALPMVNGDPAQLRQVLLNLVTNASEAHDGAHGEVTVSTFAGPLPDLELAELVGTLDIDAATAVVIGVKDRGRGIEPEIRHKLFDPFFTTKFTGRGLGLATTLGIVKQHGGAIVVRSTPGSGTTFYVLLPALTVASSATESPEPPTAQGLARFGARVLLADDNADVRETAILMLESVGCDVVAVGDGEAAVEMVQSDVGAFHIAILDVTMPRLGGIAALQKLRELAPRVPVVLASGYAEEDVAQRPGTAGAAAFLHKPFNLSELREVLHHVLRVRSIP